MIIWVSFAEFAVSLVWGAATDVRPILQSAETESLLEKSTRVAATSPRAVFKTAVRAACVIIFASSVLNFDSLLSRQRPGTEDNMGSPPSVRDVGPPLPYTLVKSGLRRGLLRDGALDALTSTNSYGLFRTLTGEAWRSRLVRLMPRFTS